MSQEERSLNIRQAAQVQLVIYGASVKNTQRMGCLWWVLIRFLYTGQVAMNVSLQIMFWELVYDSAKSRLKLISSILQLACHKESSKTNRSPLEVR